MSPRSTHTLHDGCYFQHLLAVHLIGFERGNLVSERLALLQPRGTLDDCAANRLRSAQPGRLKLVQRPERFVVQAQADRDRHSRTVSRNVIHAIVSFRAARFANARSQAFGHVPALLAGLMRRSSPLGRLRPVTLPLGILAMAAAVLLFTGSIPAGDFGGVERLAVFPLRCWLLIAGIFLLREAARSAGANPASRAATLC